MRLWHKDLIPVLPRQQLLGQWRELCLIAKNISEKGSPGHILVNKVMKYPPEHLACYGQLVLAEMRRRGYRVCPSKFFQYYPDKICPGVSHDELFLGWHSDRYFLQCYFNLQEKYDCGGIPYEEWQCIRHLGE